MSYNPKKDLGASTRFLQGILDKGTGLITQLDSQVNILIGLSSALFVFSASRIVAINSIGFMVLGVFSALSAIAGLYSIHPPKFMRRRGQKESLFYNKHITGFKNAKAYEKELIKILGDQKKITEQYALDIYNIYTYYYHPKRELFKISRNLLLVGVTISCIIYIYTSFVK